ncbi:MAG: DNA sulfur modification protein DndD [Candidatus Nanopelagicales bacterium]
MIIQELVLHNVGVYHGRQEIDLRTSPDKPVVLVGGLNGCGKTTFLDSLQLVLYGNRARLSNRGSQAWEEYLRDSINRAVPAIQGASIELSFSVDLDGEERQYRVVRQWQAAGKRIREFVSVFVDGEMNSTLSAGWAEHIEELLPLEIATLFFFDGEQIESLADPERASAVIETAIGSLLGIGTLEQLRVDLLALQRRQIPPSENHQLEQAVKDLRENRIQLDHESEDLAQRVAGKSDQLRGAQKELAIADLALSRDGGDLFEQRLQLEAQRNTRASELESARSQLRTLAESSLPLVLVADELTKLVAAATQNQDAEQAESLLRRLEERDSWLLEQLSAENATLVGALLNTDRANIAASVSERSGLEVSQNAVTRLNALPDELKRDVFAADQLIQRITGLKQDLEDLDSRLAGVPDADAIAGRIAQRDQSRIKAARLEGELGVLTEDRIALTKKKEELDTKLAKAEAERRELAVQSGDVRRLLDHTDRVRETLAALKSRLVERHISKIEVATLESLSQLMRKSGLVRDIRIDRDTFKLTLVGADGEELPPSRLSAGERQLLAVAILWGLARVAGHRLPTVIDTPLGRLDSRHRAHLVERYFPEAGSQVLLLSTDKEIDEALMHKLSPWIAHAYLLEHDDTKHSTEIQPGYWWPTEDQNGN